MARLKCNMFVKERIYEQYLLVSKMLNTCLGLDEEEEAFYGLVDELKINRLLIPKKIQEVIDDFVWDKIERLVFSPEQLYEGIDEVEGNDYISWLRMKSHARDRVASEWMEISEKVLKPYLLV